MPDNGVSSEASPMWSYPPPSISKCSLMWCLCCVIGHGLPSSLCSWDSISQEPLPQPTMAHMPTIVTGSKNHNFLIKMSLTACLISWCLFSFRLAFGKLGLPSVSPYVSLDICGYVIFFSWIWGFSTKLHEVFHFVSFSDQTPWSALLLSTYFFLSGHMDHCRPSGQNCLWMSDLIWGTVALLPL